LLGLAVLLIPVGPLDSRGHSALVHRDVAFINVVRAVKAFSGLLTFSKGGGVRVAIGKRTMQFTVGSRSALLDGQTTVRLNGVPFVLQTDTYVPVTAIAQLTGAGLVLDSKHRKIDFELDSGDSYPAAGTPSPAEGSEAAEDVMPSPAQALAFLPSATADAAGLHAKVDIVNKTAKPYAVTFPNGTQIAFIVARNGTEIWNSASDQPATLQSTLHLAAHETYSESIDWPGFAKRGPGRYTLRVRILTAAPLDTAPISLDVATPAPSPAST
jgi:hypothetical protein